MTLWFGGDYNPEQWPEEIWDDDVRLMTRAGVTVATVGVFSWAHIEPEEGRFEFAWLDDVIDRLHKAGIKVDLATATASPPPWMVHAYPDILPITSTGVRLSGGSRQHYSPSSATYRRYALRLVRALAERYGSHPALVAWHVNNEYGCHVSRCYSEESAEAFRTWLRNRYHTIDELNRAWGTSFWSQRYSDFVQVEPPRVAPTHANPTQLLDFDRFSSDALLALFQAEAAVIRDVSPDVPITTNFMGPFKPLDYWRWAEHLDFISDDSYPDPADPQSPVWSALCRDLMRSLGRGRPWILMEQSTSAVNWRPRNAIKGAGVNRALSMQSVARGADGIMYFQWRQSSSGAEKFHSGMVPHAGETSRVFREVAALGAELAELDWVQGTRVDSRVAIVFDWPSWWALEQASVPTTIDYLSQIQGWYAAFWRRTVAVDFVPSGADLSGYDLVVAPALMVADPGALGVFDDFARTGGTLVIGFQSAVLTPELHISEGGYLGALRDTLGIRIEEFAPLVRPDGGTGSVELDGGLGLNRGELWSEVIHLDGAVVRARFADGDVAGGPAVTRHDVGSGAAWYVGTSLGAQGLDRLLDAVLASTSVKEVLDEPVDGVEAVIRGEATFIINHRDRPRTISRRGNQLRLAPREVRILQEES